MKDVLFIGVGGFIGANLRYLLQLWAAGRWGPDFPYGTLLANLVGSFVLGFFLTLISERLVVSPTTRLFIATGVLGGFTTFSSFTIEALNLVQDGRWLSGGFYLLGNVGLGLLAAFLGIVLARAL